MTERLDHMLRSALAPTQKLSEECRLEMRRLAEKPASEECRREVHGFVGNRTRIVEMGSIRKARKIAAACMLIAAMGVLSVSGYAAWKYLRPTQVVENMGDQKLSGQFEKTEGTIVGDARQVFEDYTVTMLGLVAGENLSDYPYFSDGVEVQDRCFAILAIERTDSVPMPKTSEDEYAELCFFASAFAKGYDPVKVNAATLDGYYCDMVEDGILYRLVECDDISALSDQVVYVGVLDKVFYDCTAYHYDDKTGEISRNPDYEGLNALFEINMGNTMLNTIPNTIQKESAEQKKREILDRLAEKGIVIDESVRDSIPVGDKTEWDGKTMMDGKLAADGKGAVNDIAVADGNTETGNGTGDTLDALKARLSEDALGERIAAYALSFVGNPYAWGESSLTEGTDSSGFVQSVFASFQMELPRTTNQQRKEGVMVENLNDALPGDLIFYDSPAHVAIYLGDGKVVHAMPQEGVCISEADFDEIAVIRRMD